MGRLEKSARMLRWSKVVLAALCICSTVFAQSTPPESQTQTTSDGAAPVGPVLPDSEKLEVIHSRHPAYPEEAKRRGIQGEVMLKLLISEKGDVETAEVVSGDPILAQAALDAVKKWKFKPYVRNGKVVKFSAKMPFDFSFKGQVIDTPVPSLDSTPQNSSEAKTGENATPPKPTIPVAPDGLRVSPAVSQGMLIHKVVPIYPPDAKRKHIQGTVLLEATINKEGTIQTLRVISGPQELRAAAIGSVQQWRYKPYLLNGEPVAVLTSISVNFKLAK